MIGNLPADDLAGKQVRDERRVHKPAGRGHIGDIGNPAAVGGPRGEVPFQQVSPGCPEPAFGTVVRSSSARPPPEEALFARQSLHRAPCHPGAVAAQLQPYFEGYSAGRVEVQGDYG